MTGSGQIVADAAGVGEINNRPGAATLTRATSLYREHYHNRLKAKYDAAKTTPENELHWAESDQLSADSSLSPEVRKRLRERSRYEAANNSFYAGALQADADAAIGPGPSLRFFFGDDDIDSRARELFRNHARRTHLGHKIRLARVAMRRDGEVAIVRFTNRRLPESGPQVDAVLVEADRIAAPYYQPDDPKNIDGVLLDDNGQPTAYQILDRHPGDVSPYLQGDFGAFNVYDASGVIHYFHQTRPGQHRGVPVVTPCLNLFAQHRRYKLAVLTAAETAANIAAMLKLDTTLLSEALAGDGTGLILNDDELFEIVRGSMPALPPGYSLEQLKAEQPTTTLEMFERTLLREISRAMGMTYPVMSGDAGSSNMSSGNIDYRAWWRHLEPERSHLDEVVVDPIVDWWWEEQRTLPRSLPFEFRAIDRPRRRTTWSTRFEHNDPAKVANAEATYHALGLLTDDRWLEEHNLDAAEHEAELTRQVARRARHGLAPVGQQLPANQGSDERQEANPE